MRVLGRRHNGSLIPALILPPAVDEHAVCPLPRGKGEIPLRGPAQKGPHPLVATEGNGKGFCFGTLHWALALPPGNCVKGGHLPQHSVPDSTPKAFPHPNPSSNHISNRQ